MALRWFGKKKKDEAEEVPTSETESSTGTASSGDTASSTPSAEAASEPSATQGSTTTDEAPPKKESAWSRLKKGLSKTREGLSGLFGRRKLDDAFVDELEEQLYAADFGPATVEEMLESETGLRQAWKQKEIADAEEVPGFLKDLLKKRLTRRSNQLLTAESGTTVILVAGVNGTGKTTSIAKLANRLKSEGKTVVLAAADTFRAAAVEQLTIWSERIGIEIVTGKDQADPASVAYQGAERAAELEADYLIVDTAGRLHTQANLMKELGKIRSVLGKKIPDAPHEALLVLDATTGQNAIQQAESFLAAIQISGIILTKLDGTAKGGIVITINNRLDIPVKFIGVGEQLDDLQVFDPDQFVEALFD